MQISALLWAHDRLPHVNMVNMGCKSAQSHPNLLSKNPYMFLNLNLLLGLIWEDVRLKHQMHVFMSHDTRACTKVRNDWDMGLAWLFRCTMHIMGTRGFGIGTQHALYSTWRGMGHGTRYWMSWREGMERTKIFKCTFDIFLHSLG